MRCSGTAELFRIPSRSFCLAQPWLPPTLAFGECRVARFVTRTSSPRSASSSPLFLSNHADHTISLIVQLQSALHLPAKPPLASSTVAITVASVVASSAGSTRSGKSDSTNMPYSIRRESCSVHATAAIHSSANGSRCAAAGKTARARAAPATPRPSRSTRR